jgi:hypothetical protein
LSQLPTSRWAARSSNVSSHCRNRHPPWGVFFNSDSSSAFGIGGESEAPWAFTLRMVLLPAGASAARGGSAKTRTPSRRTARGKIMPLAANNGTRISDAASILPGLPHHVTLARFAVESLRIETYPLYYSRGSNTRGYARIPEKIARMTALPPHEYGSSETRAKSSNARMSG